MTRLLLAAGFVAALAIVFAISVRMLRGEASGERQVRVLSRLDEHTKAINPRIANTIPTFLMRPGTLGVLVVEPGPDDAAENPQAPAPPPTVAAIRPIDEAELRKGFCTSSLPRLVRQQFPGSYDDMPDAQLEKTVLEKRPEYRDRVCVFSVWIDAAPHDIVKYEVEPLAPFAIGTSTFVWASLITAVFGAVAGIAYGRLKIGS